MRRAVGKKLWAIGLALASVAASSACGGSSRRTEADAVAGADSVGGSGTGPVGDAGSTSGGGSTGAGGSGGAGGSASPGGTGGSSTGGAPVRFPLIVGDDACPPAAPTSDGCTALGASCVYRGIEAGLSISNEPFHCVCDGGQWNCAQSDENGELTCPGISSDPEPSDPCPASGKPCTYVMWSLPALAACYCREVGGGGGAGGAGGAEADPSSSWLCGL